MSNEITWLSIVSSTTSTSTTIERLMTKSKMLKDHNKKTLPLLQTNWKLVWKNEKLYYKQGRC
jgi:hypothetical protein